jgi:hypothetical protein
LRALQLRFDESHATLVTLTLRADDVKFIVQTSPGRFSRAEVRDFDAQSRDGVIDVGVLNVGTKLEARYAVTVTECSASIAPVPSRSVSVRPGGEVALAIPVRSAAELGAAGSQCTLRLVAEADLSIMDTRVVNFTALAVVIERGAQGGAPTAAGNVEDPLEAPGSGSSGGCAACGGIFSVICRVSRGCWMSALTSFLVIALIIVAVPIIIRFLVWAWARNRRAAAKGSQSNAPHAPCDCGNCSHSDRRDHQHRRSRDQHRDRRQQKQQKNRTARETPGSAEPPRPQVCPEDSIV